MAVAFDAAAEAQRTDTSSPFAWTHTPVGTPRCVIVFAVHGTSSTDHITAITYGGVAMTRRTRAADTTGEPGATDLWILSQAYANGAAIPTGAQSVSVTCGATTDDIWFVSMTFTGNGPVTFFGPLFIQTVDQANPQQAFDGQGKATILCLGGLYSGQNAIPITAQSGNTLVHDNLFAGSTFVGSVLRQTTPGTGAFTLGWTSTSEDVAAVFCALSEATDEDARAKTNIMPQLIAQ